MSFKDLGRDWICDLCGKTIHLDSGFRPSGFSTLTVTCHERVYLGSLTLETCESCWPRPEPEAKKTIIQKFMAKFIKATP